MNHSFVLALGLVVGTLVTTASLAAGELTVIHEHPGSRPITDFLHVPRKTAKQQPVPAPPAQPAGVMDLRTLLPIQSPELTPGPVAARAHALPVAQPLFLIGTDRRSIAWLTRHRPRLEALGAVGMLVDAADMADLELIAALAGDLPIVPAAATDIAKVLDLKHYPVCITGKHIWQ
jgi:integrating conjugative element protein (TIGR03765 family)